MVDERSPSPQPPKHLYASDEDWAPFLNKDKKFKVGTAYLPKSSTVLYPSVKRIDKNGNTFPPQRRLSRGPSPEGSVTFSEISVAAATAPYSEVSDFKWPKEVFRYILEDGRRTQIKDGIHNLARAPSSDFTNDLPNGSISSYHRRVPTPDLKPCQVRVRGGLRCWIPGTCEHYPCDCYGDPPHNHRNTIITGFLHPDEKYKSVNDALNIWLYDCNCDDQPPHFHELNSKNYANVKKIGEPHDNVKDTYWCECSSFNSRHIHRIRRGTYCTESLFQGDTPTPTSSEIRYRHLEEDIFGPGSILVQDSQGGSPTSGIIIDLTKEEAGDTPDDPINVDEDQVVGGVPSTPPSPKPTWGFGNGTSSDPLTIDFETETNEWCEAYPQIYETHLAQGVRDIRDHEAIERKEAFKRICANAGITVSEKRKREPEENSSSKRSRSN